VNSRWNWNGKLIFDIPRHRENFNMPVDYARLNQFPEWFTVDKNANYKITVISSGEDTSLIMPGSELREGFEIETTGSAVKPIGDKPVRIKVVVIK
jgi:hypothetical protein